MELLLLDRVVDLVEEGVDAAIRIAHLPESSLVAVRVGETRRVLCATPAYLARAGTPPAIVNKLSNEIAKILAMPDIRDRLLASGMEPFHTGPEKMAAQMKSDHAEADGVSALEPQDGRIRLGAEFHA